MKYLLFLLLAFPIVTADAATTYRGRVQYASTGKPLKNVLVEARMHPTPHILFFAPRTFAVVATTSTRPDGTFEFTLSERGRRLHFVAQGRMREVGKKLLVVTDREVVAPSPKTPNIISVPDDFRPWHPKPPKRSNHTMERTATRRAFTFRVAGAPPLRATLALAGRRSSCSR
jgi:hypothetical protein